MTRRLPALLGLVALLCVSVALGLLFGDRPVSLPRALTGEGADQVILFELRLPRVLLAAMVGAALASSGAALQALMRNPLADPFILGVSGGAALGTTVALVIGLEVSVSSWSLVGPAGSALAGAGVATLVVLAMGKAAGGAPHATLLAGVVFNALALAAVTFIRTLASPESTAALLYWMAGVIGHPSAATLGIAAFAELIAVGVLLLLAGQLNLLSLGDDEARALGVVVERTRALVLLACSLAVAIAVTLSGLVGFVGLIVPQALRLWVGGDQRALLPSSALGGAAFLVLADLGSRSCFALFHAEPPVGALTSLIGGPIFLALLLHGGRRRLV